VISELLSGEDQWLTRREKIFGKSKAVNKPFYNTIYILFKPLCLMSKDSRWYHLLKKEEEANGLVGVKISLLCSKKVFYTSIV
jgi:hypothetical protein